MHRRLHLRGGLSSRVCALGLAAACAASLCAQPIALRLDLPPAGPTHPAAPRITATGPSNHVFRLEHSSDLGQWQEMARSHDGLEGYPDRGGSEANLRFYRVRAHPRTTADDWKNQISSAGDALRSPEAPTWAPESRWIKFALVLDDPHRVYFQDSTKYSFHYDYAVARLPGFGGLSREAFDRVALRTNGQAVVLGAVIFPPTTNHPEYGLQFAGLDAFPREQIAAWFATVDAMIVRPDGVRSLYLPTFEQSGVARDHAAWFAAQGISIASTARWLVSDQTYAAGWAFGRLVFVPAVDIAQAYTDGTLRPEDILLTDAVPAEVPPLAGILTLSPATPNSHVAILAQSFGIPFVYPADPTVRSNLLRWAGGPIVLRAVQEFGGNEVLVRPAATDPPTDLQNEIDALRRPASLDLTPKARRGQYTVAADTLHPADIRYVGGKAANFGVVRRALPTNAPSPALAFTFDLWDDYLDQPWPGGGSLRLAISNRLAGFAWPPNMAALQTALAEVRDWVEDLADFSPTQQTAILEALQDAGFVTGRNIRMRSSTNVEDAEKFSGAGLYESYSGCLADDLDGDPSGPSVCDPTEARERGVFRALRKVYASFYRDNAFLERLRHGVDESDVGMAVLAHYSSPDPEELANGVATLEIWKEFQRSVTATLVLQAGAVSIANPDSTARPERVTGSSFGSSSFFLSLDERSSLVPLGDTVLTWETEYQRLIQLLDRVARGYEAEFPAKQHLLLDLEFKKLEPGGLSVKQVREVPQIDPNQMLPAYLIGTDEHLGVFQGEYGDVIANHRLKSLWDLRVDHRRLAATNLQHSLFTTLHLDWQRGTNVAQWSGPFTNLPGYAFARTTEGTLESWQPDTTGLFRSWSLRVHVPETRRAAEGPLTVLGDHLIELSASYLTPQPALGWQPVLTNTLTDSVRLAPIQPPTAESLPQTRRLKLKQLTATTRFYWPPMPTGAVAGYTAPLQAWVETLLEGLTAQPITLRSDFSQTYRPGHHNFNEDFLFDPWREPGLPAAVLDELAAQNIRAVILTGNQWDETATGYLWGLDNVLRPF